MKKNNKRAILILMAAFILGAGIAVAAGYKYVKCGACQGVGSKICYSCSGTGKIRHTSGATMICAACHGNGRIQCSQCGGSGVRRY